MSHDPHHIIEVLPVHLRLALPAGSARRRYALKLGESAAAAHVFDGVEVADDRYDQLFAGHRPQSHKSIIAVPHASVHLAVRGRTDGLSALVGAPSVRS